MKERTQENIKIRMHNIQNTQRTLKLGNLLMFQLKMSSFTGKAETIPDT